jgi:hypothetical protein
VKVELPSTSPVVDPKESIMHPYCGPKNLKLAPLYTLFKDFKNGDFVLVRPDDPFLVPIWMGRT